MPSAATMAAESARPLVLKNQAPCDKQPLLKEVGLTVLNMLVQRIKPSKTAVDRVTKLLQSIPHGTLFPDWSPPTAGLEVPIAFSKDSITCESRRNGASARAENALHSGAKLNTRFWSSAQNKEESWWQVTMPGQPTVLSSVKFASSAGSLSEKAVLLVRPTTAAPWRAVGYLPGASLGTGVTVNLDSQPVEAMRVVLSGFPKENTDKVHTLKDVVVMRAKTGRLHTKASAVVASVERWLLGAARGSATCQEESFAALMRFALASGALTSVLRVADAALSVGDKPLTEEFGQTGGSFLGSIKDQYFDVCGMSGSRSGGVVERSDVLFPDGPDSCSSGITIEEGGKLVKCTSGNAHALMNVSFKTGKASWELKLVQDSANGECSCMGLAVKPVTNSNYEHSPSLWMYRAYNGNLYERGRNMNTPKEKYHPGNIVRFELDMDAGTCSVGVNGASPQVAWSNLSGLEIWPAVAFYSSNRSIQLMSFQAASGGAEAVSFLSSHKDIKSVTEKAVGLSYAGKKSDGKPPMLSKVEFPSSIGFYPRTGKEATAEFSIAGADTDTFRATIGLEDGIGEAKMEGSVVFSVFGDDGLVPLYQSPPISAAGDTHELDLHITGVRSLKLQVACNGPNEHARAVFGNARTLSAPWWWEYKQLEKEGSPIVEATKSNPSTFFDLGERMLLLLQLYASESLRSMRTTRPPTAGDTAMDLELPFTLQIAPSTFRIIEDLLKRLVPRACDGDAHSLHMAVSLMKILQANLRRLIVSGVEPRDAGVSVGSSPSEEDSKGKEDEQESKAAPERTLGGLHDLLAQLAGKPGERKDGVPDTLSFEAGETLDVGVDLFFPSAAEREAHISDTLESGCVVECHFKWPCHTADDEAEDSRFERAALLFQSTCRKNKWQCAMNGQWNSSLHVVVEVPAGRVIQLLKDELSTIMSTAGFSGWQFPTGCAHPEIKIKIERSLGFNRVERLKTEAGAGWVRVYPLGVGSFEAVNAEVDSYVESEQQKIEEQAAARKKAEAAVKAATPEKADEPEAEAEAEPEEVGASQH